MSWLPWVQAAATIYDSYTSRKDRKNANAANQSIQERFAKEGVQWRVEDAKKAGIHPLAAMGASLSSPSFGSQPVGGSVASDALNAYQRAKETPQQKIAMKSMEADTTLKLAQASKLAKETQQINSVQPMFRQVFDNNPDSKTYGKKIWIPHEDIAESMEGSGAFWSSVYSSTSSALFNKQKQLEKARKIKEHRKAVKKHGKYGTFRMKVPDGTGGYKYVYKKSPYPYADD